MSWVKDHPIKHSAGPGCSERSKAGSPGNSALVNVLYEKSTSQGVLNRKGFKRE
jgi:hypothetical protein